MPGVTTDDINERAREYFRNSLAKALELAFELPHDPLCDVGAEIEMLSRDIAMMRSQLAKQSFSDSVRVDAQALVDGANGSNGAGGPKCDIETFQYACNAVLRAQMENARIHAAQLAGEYDATAPRDPLFHGIVATLPPLPGEDVKPTSQSHTLSSIAVQFYEQKVKHNWVAKTAADMKRVLTLVEAVVGGGKPMHSFDIDDVKVVRDTLAKLPPNYMKLGANKGLSPQQAAVANKSGASLSVKTQDKYFTMFRQLLGWAVDEGYLDKMPGGGVKVAGVGSTNPAEQRDPYSVDQLQMIFSSPLYTGHKSEECRHKPGKMIVRDGKFWVPLIALYSGMRMGEIVQLLVADVKQDGDIWYFDVNKAEGKSLKTVSSKRRVPVHRTLVELGLLDKVKSGKAKDRIFSDIQPGKDGYYSHNPSKWWGRYSRQVGFKSKKTAFHSFRHNFKDALQAAEAPEYIAKALMGHAEKSVHGQYGSGPPLSALHLAVDKIDYGVVIVAKGPPQ
jgi:integrase